MHGQLLDDVSYALDSSNTVKVFLEQQIITSQIDPLTLERLRTLVGHVVEQPQAEASPMPAAAPSRVQPAASPSSAPAPRVQPTASPRPAPAPSVKPSAPSKGKPSLASASAKPAIKSTVARTPLPPLPRHISIGHFWAQNPGVREWALCQPDSKGGARFLPGIFQTEYDYIVNIIEHNPKIKCARTLPGNISLDLFWMQNPGIREWGLNPPNGKPRFKSGDRKSELAFARSYYKAYPSKAKWGPRELPKDAPLELFWKLNPGVREWGLNPIKEVSLDLRRAILNKKEHLLRHTISGTLGPSGTLVDFYLNRLR